MPGADHSAAFEHCYSGAQRSAPASNATAICQTFVKESNLAANKVGNARTTAKQDAAWANWIATTRASAAQATDVKLKSDLTLFADGLVRIAAQPGDLHERYDSVEKSDPTYYAAVNAASDRLEVTCGPITGII
ncbi:MAG TPA: hypothetical protein VLL08_03870 [Kineosporiaceae bacterium]|nr:hypothetical protein [Kineosporiaceae bacterium]